MGGKEAPADNEDDADSPGILRGREDIHGQGGAVLSPVDHVFLAIECGFAGFDERRAECDKRTHDKHHPGQGSIHHRNSWSSKLLGYKLLVVSLSRISPCRCGIRRTSTWSGRRAARWGRFWRAFGKCLSPGSGMPRSTGARLLPSCGSKRRLRITPRHRKSG